MVDYRQRVCGYRRVNRRETEIKTSAKVLVQKVQDEAVLLDLDSQSYFGLDPVATVIWEEISENKTEEEIVDRIIREFEVGADVAKRDLRQFLQKLKDEKLIVSEWA